MIRRVEDHRPAQVIMITDCSMSDNVNVEFVRPCNLCPQMKMINLDNILHSLRTTTLEVIVDPATATRARLAVECMLDVKVAR